MNQNRVIKWLISGVILVLVLCLGSILNSRGIVKIDIAPTQSQPQLSTSNAVNAKASLGELLTYSGMILTMAGTIATLVGIGILFSFRDYERKLHDHSRIAENAVSSCTAIEQRTIKTCADIQAQVEKMMIESKNTMLEMIDFHDRERLLPMMADLQRRALYRAELQGLTEASSIAMLFKVQMLSMGFAASTSPESRKGLLKLMSTEKIFLRELLERLKQDKALHAKFSEDIIYGYELIDTHEFST